MLREDWEGLKGMHLTNVQIHETKLVELRERANKPTSAGDSNNPPPLQDKRTDPEGKGISKDTVEPDVTICQLEKTESHSLLREKTS